jgi:hypothetical protein
MYISLDLINGIQPRASVELDLTRVTILPSYCTFPFALLFAYRLYECPTKLVPVDHVQPTDMLTDYVILAIRSLDDKHPRGCTRSEMKR